MRTASAAHGTSSTADRILCSGKSRDQAVSAHSQFVHSRVPGYAEHSLEQLQGLRGHGHLLTPRHTVRNTPERARTIFVVRSDEGR